MGTSCRIAVLAYVDNHDEEHYRSIHCHYDGYLMGVGAELLQYYNSYNDALMLSSIGDIRCLCTTVVETLSQRYYGTVYRDDLGITDLLDSWNTAGESNLYLYANDKWYVYSTEDNYFHSLKNKLRGLQHV